MFNNNNNNQNRGFGRSNNGSTGSNNSNGGSGNRRPQSGGNSSFGNNGGGGNRRSFGQGGGNRSGFNQAAPKTTATAIERPEFVHRRRFSPEQDAENNAALASVLGSIESVRNVKHTNLQAGNLAVNHLNPMFTAGASINTNSPQFFPEGKPVRVIPIGGSNEVGLNINAFECGDDIIIIDTGMGFGGPEFPGVDLIVPDTTYLEENKHKIRGLIYTHGHLDHIGAAPYVLPKLGPIPIYSLPLTLALLKNRLQEFDIDQQFIAKIINLNETLELGCFKIDFFRLNHSLPDVVGLAINTPMGRIVYTTDWKFDDTPYDGLLSDYSKLASYGHDGVRLLMTDSLGILKDGKSMSEMVIKKAIMSIFKDCTERVIVTSFASTIPRIQFTIDACVKYGRKLSLVGRSMVNNFNVCTQLGYIAVPKGLVVDLNEMNKLPSDQVCFLMTGSQGEDLAALTRLSRDEHDLIKLQAGDSVIFSSRPIEGNESAVESLIASLSRKGVEVYSNKEFAVHVGGHACRDDLKLLFALTRPDYLQPMHGDHYIIRKTSELGVEMGIPFEHCLLSENGRVTEMRETEVVVTEEIVNNKYLIVDGTSVGLVSEVVLEERRNMGSNGSVVMVVTINKQKRLVAGPELISRGFVYMKSGKELFEEVKDEIRAKFDNIKADPNSATYFTELRNSLKTIATEVIFEKTNKMPMIIPVVVQI